jgi:flagellar hook-associated protein 2
VADAVPGLTLNLKMPGTSTVTISTDTAAATKVMQEFVTAYNAALAAINTETKYDAKTKEASTLTGDAQMRGATSQLRSVMSSVLKDLAGDKLDAEGDRPGDPRLSQCRRHADAGHHQVRRRTGQPAGEDAPGDHR